MGSALSLKAVIRIACKYYPSLYRGFQLIYRKINLLLVNHVRQSVQNQSQNAKHCILNTVEPLLCSQTSFSRCKFAHKGRREEGKLALNISLSIRRFWGKGEGWSEKGSFLSLLPLPPIPSKISSPLAPQEGLILRLLNIGSSFSFPWSLARRHQSLAFCTRIRSRPKSKNEATDQEKAGRTSFKRFQYSYSSNLKVAGI